MHVKVASLVVLLYRHLSEICGSVFCLRQGRYRCCCYRHSALKALCALIYISLTTSSKILRLSCVKSQDASCSQTAFLIPGGKVGITHTIKMVFLSFCKVKQSTHEIA